MFFPAGTGANILLLPTAKVGKIQGKIFDIDVPNVIITSTPKGLTNFPQIW